MNYTALTTAARKYQFDGSLRNTIDTIDATVPGDVAVPVTFTPGTAGNYTITLEGGYTQFGAIPSRYAFRIEGAAGTPRAMVMGDFPSSPDENLVSAAGCSGCHGTMGNGFHYGYPTNGATCTVCHDATNTTYPRLVNIGHGIHNSHNMPGGEFQLKDTAGGDVEDPYSVTYPTYMTNCSVCHTEGSGALAQFNAMPVTGGGCLSCHGTMASWDFAASGTTFHESMDATTRCQDCHGRTAWRRRRSRSRTSTTASRPSASASSKTVQSLGIEGAKCTCDHRQRRGRVEPEDLVDVTDDGAPVNPCNTTVAANAPGFHAVPVIEGALSVLRSYAQGDDFIRGKSTSAPGRPMP